MLTPPPPPLRSVHPRLPGLRVTFFAGLAVAAILALVPQMVRSAPAPSQGTLAELGAPVARLLNLHNQQWRNPEFVYAPLPQRSAEQNELLRRAVSVLTHGSAVESRRRLLSLEGSLRQELAELGRMKMDAALTPADPCLNPAGNFLTRVSSISCRFSPTRAERIEVLRDQEGTIRQRTTQIAAERVRFAADLRDVGLDVSPEQVDGLLQLASARDLIGLHSAYANLRGITGQLQQVMVRPDAGPAAAQRYFGIYVVLLEVALHMHEDFYLRVNDTYLPQIDGLIQQTRSTYQRARTLANHTHNPELRARLQGNLATLENTLKMAISYRRTLLEQTRATNSSWQALYEQHEVAVNSYRTATLSDELLKQVRSAHQVMGTMQAIDVPALQPALSGAVQQTPGTPPASPLRQRS